MIQFEYRDNCPSCNSDTKSQLMNLPFESSKMRAFLDSYYDKNTIPKLDSAYEVSACHDCNTLWQSYILNNAGMELLYDRWISPAKSLEKRKKYSLAYFKNLSDECTFNISLFNARPSSLRFLDFGMGWGEWAKMTKGFGIQTYVAELSEERKNFARSLGLEIYQESDGEFFDFINLDQVLEHLSRPRDIMEMLYKSLRPGGIVKISVPNGSHQEKGLKSEFWKPAKDALHPLEHINCYTPGSLVQFCSHIGLVPLKVSKMIQLKENSPLYLLKKIIKQKTSTTVYFVKESAAS